jgi:tellurite resistance protein
MHSVQPNRDIPTRASSPVRHVPIGLFASVMSLSGLSLAWRLAAKMYGADIAVSNAIGIVSLAVFTLLALSYINKFFRYRNLVKQEFSHPVIGNFFGTVGISILLLSSVVSIYSTAAQLVVWIIGVIVTLLLSVVIISRLLDGNGSPTSVVPAWLIAGVGSLDIVVTGGSFASAWAHEINLLAAAVGSVSAIVFFVLIFSRLVHHEPLAAGMRPSKMILVAPFAVGFVAYVNLVQKVDMFAALLFYFGLFLFVIISYRLLRKPASFSPNWWAIGFPMAALSNAALMYSNAVGGPVVNFIAVSLLILLSACILVLSIRTLHTLANGRFLAA